MSAAGHERFEGDLAAWALGALEPGEAKEFERHLARCEQCRTDLNWLRPAVDALPASVTQIAPPPRLRGELLAAVRTDARRAKRDRGGGSLFSRPRFRIPRPALAALGAAALVGAGVAGYALRGDSGEKMVPVQASGAAAGASAELVVDGDVATLHARQMPALRGNQVFQAWLVEPGKRKPDPSTVFVRERGGAASATLDGVEGADRVMVTREPRGGSSHPTGAPLLTAAL